MDARTFKHALVAVAALGLAALVGVVAVALMFPAEARPAETGWIDAPGGAAAWPAPVTNAGEPLPLPHGSQVRVLARVENRHGRFCLVRLGDAEGYVESRYVVDSRPPTEAGASATPTKRKTAPTLEILSTNDRKISASTQIVVGEVRNNGSTTARLIKVTVTTYDRNGDVVDTGTSSVDDIPPGGTVPFTVYLYYSPAAVTYRTRASYW